MMIYGHNPLLPGLREAVDGFVRGDVTPSALNRFIRICHSLALSQLSNRRNTVVLSKVHGLNASDLAFDCISDLFQRDEEGHYLQLETYFRGFPLNQMADPELLVLLRRLVSSKVHQGIFRLLNEADPSLGKILRNIKLAVPALNQFEEVERFGETFIRTSLCDPLDHLPEPTSEQIERALLETVPGPAFVPELLSRLSVFLRSQRDTRRTVPLVTVALAFRSLYAARTRLPSDLVEAEQLPAVFDGPAIVRMTMRELRIRASRFVARGKVTAELLDHYCAVIEEGLTRRIVHANGEGFTLFGALHQRDPRISRARYRAVHRSRLEYLARLANEIAAELMTRE